MLCRLHQRANGWRLCAGIVTLALGRKLGYTKSSNKDDPRRSKRMVKGGKLQMLQSEAGDLGMSWCLYYLCIVDSFIYYFRSSRQEDGDDETESLSSQTASWKGCINLQLATVELAPAGAGGGLP